MGWLAIVDDLRTFDWVGNVTYPQLLQKDIQSFSKQKTSLSASFLS